MQRENKPIPVPSYHQVYEFVKSISQETSVKEARSGLPHASTGAHVTKVLCPLHSLSSPICQVDEHTMDLLVVTPDGTVSPDGFTEPCSSVSKRQQSWRQCCRWTVCVKKTTCGW